MIKSLTATLLFLAHLSYAQIGGDIHADSRKIIQNIDYTIPSSKDGKMVFKIAVDMDGNVTSCVLEKNLSTISSTPYMVKYKNLILTSLKFERGYTFPEHHQGTVTIQFGDYPQED